MSSPEKLLSFIKDFEGVIKEHTIKKQPKLKKFIQKLRIRVTISEGNYWIFINEKKESLFNDAISKFGIQESNVNDYFIYQKMKNELTVDEYFQLCKIMESF